MAPIDTISKDTSVVDINYLKHSICMVTAVTAKQLDQFIREISSLFDDSKSIITNIN